LQFEAAWALVIKFLSPLSFFPQTQRFSSDEHCVGDFGKHAVYCGFGSSSTVRKVVEIWQSRYYEPEYLGIGKRCWRQSQVSRCGHNPWLRSAHFGYY
jgi:uncharacterized protein YfaQ (DUF2300 family)